MTRISQPFEEGSFQRILQRSSPRIAVFVSGGGTNLQALIDAQKEGKLAGGEISLVVSTKSGVLALERAEKAGIKTITIEKKQYADIGQWDSALKNALSENKIDFVVLAGFLSILGPLVLQSYENRIINVHPALIPSFCGKGFYGLRVHEAVLEYGVKVTGATVHFVNNVVDGGKIILQKAIDVLPGDTPETLQQRVMREGEWELLPKAVAMFCRGELCGNRS
ncbi:MAG: phosphoribosylglycinamide formyltransferase [Treponema sp.]|jgi:phosphoribosylglycinamide formyltransferase-1|nr:phosphoribosylglycinamide formyltransferase [Treponema sp.]